MFIFLSPMPEALGLNQLSYTLTAKHTDARNDSPNEPHWLQLSDTSLWSNSLLRHFKLTTSRRGRNTKVAPLTSLLASQWAHCCTFRSTAECQRKDDGHCPSPSSQLCSSATAEVNVCGIWKFSFLKMLTSIWMTCPGSVSLQTHYATLEQYTGGQFAYR